MKRHSAAALAVIPLAVVVAGCGSSATKSVALPSIAAPTTASDSPAPTAPTSSAAPTSPVSTVPTPAPTLLSETIAPASATPTTSPTSSALTNYSNERYGFTAKYPADFTKATPPVDGDGQLFNSPDQAASFTVSGVNNNNHQSVDEVYAAATSPGDTTITYANKTGNVITVSGTNNNRVVYEREVVGAGSIDSLLWTYPVADKPRFDPLVTLTARNFTAGDVTTTH